MKRTLILSILALVIGMLLVIAVTAGDGSPVEGEPIVEANL